MTKRVCPSCGQLKRPYRLNRRQCVECNRKRDRKRARQRRKANPKKYRAAYNDRRRRRYAISPEKYREANYQWQLVNPETRKAIKHRRRTRKRNAPGFHTAADIKSLLTKSKRRCFYCMTKVRKYHIEHFIPLSRGGSNWPRNLRIACELCNTSKGAKMPWEWMPLAYGIG